MLGGIRIPFARQNGPYARASNQDMLTATLDALVAEVRDLEGEVIGEVAAGAVLKHSRDFNLTRESVLGLEARAGDAGLRRPAGVRHRARGTILLVPNKIALGQIESGIAGGVDTTSDAPIAINEDLRDGAARAQPGARANAPRCGGREAPPAADRPRDPPQRRAAHGPLDGRTLRDHGQEWGIGREEQDELAVASHHKLAAAYDTGFLDDLVVPYLGLERDQNLRPDSSVEKLAKLKPVFGGPDGTMTAGNSTPLSDGASTVLLASEEWAAEHGLEPQAYLIDAQTAAVDYVHKREGLLMAPAYAVPRLLDAPG